MFDNLINELREAAKNDTKVQITTTALDGVSSRWLFSPKEIEIDEDSIFIQNNDGFFSLSLKNISYDDVLDQYLLKNEYSFATIQF